MQAAGVLYAVLGLPLLTNPGDQTKIQVFLHVEPLPNITGSCARGANRIGGFGLVGPWLTIPYQVSILGQGRPCVTFTNLYHRDGGLTIDPDL